MPPRKSDASKVVTADEATPAKELAVRDGINIEDFNLPKSIVTRLAKGVLPPNTQIQGNAMLALTKSATVFVNYLIASANDHASSSNRKTVGPQDIFNALNDVEFPDFRDRLEEELAKFNEVQTDKRSAYRSKVASKAADVGDEEDKDGQPAAKKARLEPDGGDVKNGESGDGEVGDADQSNDEAEEEDGDVPEEEEEEEEEQENLEVEDPLEEEAETKEADDEALDNGEDSD